MYSTGGGGGGGGGIRIEVEVRRRVQATDPALNLGAATAKTATSASTRTKYPRLIKEAYCDDRFDCPTRFFTVAPEHPKLGKWAQPSTLKYTATTIINHSHTDGRRGMAPPRQAIHPTVAAVPSFANKPDNRQNISGKSGATAARPGRPASSLSRASEIFNPARGKSSTPEMGVELGLKAKSPPARSGHHHIQDQQQKHTATLRIDTPISGRVSSHATTNNPDGHGFLSFCHRILVY